MATETQGGQEIVLTKPKMLCIELVYNEDQGEVGDNVYTKTQIETESHKRHLLTQWVFFKVLPHFKWY